MITGHFSLLADSDGTIALMAASSEAMMDRILAQDHSIAQVINSVIEDPASGAQLAQDAVNAIPIPCSPLHRHPHEMTLIAALYALFRANRTHFQALADAILDSRLPSMPWTKRYAKRAMSNDVRSLATYEPFSLLKGGIVCEGMYSAQAKVTFTGSNDVWGNANG